ncbi:2TM domain-containing protein [Clostridium oryzae]|uniref:2TM domain-containing protein n=1 Tax=Clostridium oryzae TaxID=1450648 RepID=A0A1V4IQE8_9CLOT|nr:2TM domain-containing protein [Clostridium oryzae]OPJ62248.1 hypothetical protein CLORY_18560 [Clostridium oryzae]
MSENNEVDQFGQEKKLSEQELEQLALQRLKIKRGFTTHLGVYLVVNACFFGMNVLTSLRYPWFLWPALGWGIGLGCHYVNTVSKLRMTGNKNALKREIDYLRNKLNE